MLQINKGKLLRNWLEHNIQTNPPFLDTLAHFYHLPSKSYIFPTSLAAKRDDNKHVKQQEDMAGLDS
jgi:hypothetical protein